MEKFQEVKDLILSTEVDAGKFFEKGNKAAGVRLRRVLQEVKQLSHEVRKQVLAARTVR